MTVLLLDSTYEPLRIISWMKAMTLIISGDAEIVEEKTEEVVRSSSKTFKMPSVIRQLAKFRKRREIQFSRINVYLRDNWTCQYCEDKKQTKELTFDHVIPRVQGGLTNWTNIVAACQPCNAEKADMTPEQARMKLIKKPVKPKWLPAQVIVKIKSMPNEWTPYIDANSVAYWTQQLESDSICV
jgi:5-methylcytosine-specific restriction endonuclease McrA